MTAAVGTMVICTTISVSVFPSRKVITLYLFTPFCSNTALLCSTRGFWPHIFLCAERSRGDTFATLLPGLCSNPAHMMSPLSVFSPSTPACHTLVFHLSSLSLELQLTTCLFKLWVIWKSNEFTRNCLLFCRTMSGSNICVVDLQKICLTIPLPALLFQTDFRNFVSKHSISTLSYLPHLHSTETTEDVDAVELHFTFQRHLSVRSLIAVGMYCFLAWHLHGPSIKYCLLQQSSCPGKWNSPFFSSFPANITFLSFYIPPTFISFDLELHTHRLYTQIQRHYRNNWKNLGASQSIVTQS